MKITPLEIRQKAFEKKLRGYDKDEVQAFLNSLSQEWERLNNENKDLKMKLSNAEKDVQRLREVEASLFKTLKTAEDTGANLIDQANKTASLQLREAQMQAEAMLSEARSAAKDTIDDAEHQAKYMLSSAQNQLKDLHAEFKSIEAQRESLLLELRSIAGETLERVEKLRNKNRSFSDFKPTTSSDEYNFSAPPPPSPRPEKPKKTPQFKPIEEVTKKGSLDILSAHNEEPETPEAPKYFEKEPGISQSNLGDTDNAPIDEMIEEIVLDDSVFEALPPNAEKKAKKEIITDSETKEEAIAQETVEIPEETTTSTIQWDVSSSNNVDIDKEDDIQAQPSENKQEEPKKDNSGSFFDAL